MQWYRQRHRCDRTVRTTHPHHPHHPRFKHTRFSGVRRSLRFVLVTFHCTFMWMMRGPQPSVAHAAGAAKRRRERRLRQFLWHERLTVAMLLAERQHHAAHGDRAGPGAGGGNEVRLMQVAPFCVGDFCCAFRCRPWLVLASQRAPQCGGDSDGSVSGIATSG